MAMFGYRPLTSAALVASLVVLSSSTADAACVEKNLKTCLGDKATCLTYFHYNKNYCPGEQIYTYRNMEEKTELGYGAPSYGHPQPHQPGLEKFLCPCKATLEKYFKKVLETNSCSAAKSSGYGSYAGQEYTCSTCASRCDTPNGDGHYRNLNDQESYAPGYGAPAPAGYSAHAPAGYGGYDHYGGGGYGHICDCEELKMAAVAEFCIDFVGDFKDFGGYGGGYGSPGYRNLDGGESYAPDPYAHPYGYGVCSEECVIPCIEYVLDCCTESDDTICPGPPKYGPSHGGY